MTSSTHLRHTINDVFDARDTQNNVFDAFETHENTSPTRVRLTNWWIRHNWLKWMMEFSSSLKGNWLHFKGVSRSFKESFILREFQGVWLDTERSKDKDKRKAGDKRWEDRHCLSPDAATCLSWKYLNFNLKTSESHWKC